MEKDMRGNIIVKVGIYLRKSRAEDGTQDLKKHKDYLVKVCKDKGWLFDLYEEIDSSQELNRNELQRLRQDIELGKIDAVMVNAVDRLSRRARHFLEIVEDYFIAKNMTKLFEREVEHNLLDTTTITMLQIKATLSQAEYSFIVARLNQGRKQAANKGIWSGKMVYGFEFDNEQRKIVTVEKEKPIVRKICDLTLEGYSYGAVCKELNRLGYRTRKGNEFDIHNIKSIVHSPFIRGHVEVNWGDGEKTYVRDNHDAIISDAEYEKMKLILDRRSQQYTHKSSAPKHYLQGLLRCSKCGLVMVVQANKESKYNEGVRLYGDYRYYVRKCLSKDCENYGCNVSIVEDTIKKVLNEFSSQIMKKIDQLSNINQEDIKIGFQNRVREIKNAITKLDNKEESLLDLLLDKTINKDTYNKRIESLKEEKAELVSELNSLPTMDVEQESKHVHNIVNLIERFEEIDGEDKRRLLQLAFSKIDYTRLSKKDTPTLDCYPN